MHYGRLPAFQTKKDDDGKPLPAVVTITNSVLNKDKTPEGQKVTPVEFKFPAETMEFTQYDSIQEFVEDCGSEERLLEILNEVTGKFATAAGKTAIRTATSGNEDEIISAGLRVSKNYSWKVETKLSVKDKAAKFDEIMNLASSLDPAELAARIAELSAK